MLMSRPYATFATKKSTTSATARRIKFRPLTTWSNRLTEDWLRIGPPPTFALWSSVRLVRPTLKGDTRRRPMVLPPLLKVVLGNSVLTGAPRRRPRSASLSKASMTTRGPFNRILHDSECRWGADGLAGGEGVPAGAQAPVEQMRALAFRVDG
jgi:hypothetical protein